VSNTIVTIEKKPWLRPERAASLLRLLVVVAVHGTVIAALLSWSWPPAPIEVSILSLEDLGGEMLASSELSAAERLTPDAEAAAPATEISPTAVAPALELAQPQQIEIALSQLVPPTPESQPTTSASTPVPPKAPAAATVRLTPDLDASARPRSVAKVMAPNGGATATPNSASTGNTGLTGHASGSAQPGAGTEPALTAARFDADYLHNPAPAYPAQSRRLKEEGTVLLLVQVSVEGTPLSVEIRTSSGFERLDEAGLQAVRQWRFVPAKRGSENVAASVLVPIQFKRQ
jgi:protein TonB